MDVFFPILPYCVSFFQHDHDFLCRQQLFLFDRFESNIFLCRLQPYQLDNQDAIHESF